MIFNSIHLQEGYNKKPVEFSAGNNLIFSKENSKGKTTLLRVLLYSIGYNIPNTKNIKFERCIITTSLTNDKNKVIILRRENRECIHVQEGEDLTTYYLPIQENELHQQLFDIDSQELLKNLLGLFYFDQEKGWTLLNRGVVIGKIHFNIEELIRGLEKVDCSKDFELLEETEQNLEKFKQMFSVSKYQQSIDMESNKLDVDSYDEEIDAQLTQLRMEKNLYQKELLRINSLSKENHAVKSYLNKMGLVVRINPNQDPIRITSENIVWLDDTTDFLGAKRKIIASKLTKLQQEIDSIDKAHKKEKQQLSFFNDTETISEMFDKRISEIPINEQAVHKNIKLLEKQRKDIKQRIRKLTYDASYESPKEIYKLYKEYLEELEIKDYALRGKDIFTSQLKELSGAILHKIVFAFRLACLKVLEQQCNIKLPIILDSPRSSEIDDDNIEKMMKILNRDFTENQIIIASIHEYPNLDGIKRIEIQNRLIE